MKNSEIRAEIVELINGGMNKVSQIISFFREYRKEVNLKEVRTEAAELIKELDR
jgi:hypothetical protein